ncbi:DM13 domain-containing protein [Spongiimicrobium salis]|uniref:DM13 domain-containing protein n=1 Tax=Spongiimicrobium salis TaxID=1667022 RepID=UPI00374D0668
MKNLSPMKISIFSFLLFFAVQTTVAQTVKKAKWEKQNKSINGTFEIVKKESGTYIVLSDDFKTKSAPDLKIFLSKKSLSTITGKNATKDAVLVSKLKNAKGGQSYKLSGSVKLSEYKSIIIHCEEYGIFWGGSSL